MNGDREIAGDSRAKGVRWWQAGSSVVAIARETQRLVTSHMHCLKCKGFMMVERHYTMVNRRLYARCLNCGFWLDLADLLRFFHKVIDSGVRGLKVRETLTL